MKAVLWPYKYASMGTNWSRQMLWVVRALLAVGVVVKRHKDFQCEGLSLLPLYEWPSDQNTNICIYNHAVDSEIIGSVLPTRANWFFKPTVPDKDHTTLDPLGYGPYSSITYMKPPFESVKVGDFFETKVRQWIDSKVCKWGTALSGITPVNEDDYYLVIGQCDGDSVLTQMDFGSYITKLEQVVRELIRVGDRPVVVKLHPYMNGEPGKEVKGFAEGVQQRLESISPRVHVYRGMVNIHNFIAKARCVLLANSGAGLEAMMHHKPIIAWGFPEYHWVTYDLRHLCDLRWALKLDWFDAGKQDQFLCWYLEHYCFHDQSSCQRRVNELLSVL